LKTDKAEHITLDRIRSWLNDPDSETLSPKDREIYDRWDYAYDQLKIEKPAAVANRLMQKFNIKRSQAFKDILDCQRLLNPVNRRDLEWIRNYIVDDAILQMKVAKEALDFKAWEKARADLIKIYAIEKNDIVGIDPELLGNNQYYIQLNVNNENKVIDMTKIHKLPEKKREELCEFLFQDIDIDDAEEMMKS
jgi:hypothetical protein